MKLPIPNYIHKNILITEKTYYKMGGTARFFALPNNIYEVQQTLLFCQQNRLPCAILGSGSNSVYADGEFAGLILSLEKMQAWHWESDDYLFVEAGVTNTEIAEICAAANRAGASWMYRMPGQIGGTVRMNARCYGGEISTIAKEIITLNSHGELITYQSSNIFQGYKKTMLMSSPHIVVGVRLFFPHQTPAEKLIAHMHECEADRHQKKHFYLPSCGSTFKNNYDVGKPSGRIFDELGLKGKQIGNAVVSEYHANFIWNCGQAKTADMLALSAFMREEAKREKNIDLELEVQPIGVFSQNIFNQCGMENLGQSFSYGSNKKWVGLFSFPKQKEKNYRILPQTIFSSPFFEYHQTPLLGETKIQVNLIQLQPLEEARKNPKTPFLKWETRCEGEIDKLFPLQVKENTSVKELWHYSVSEIFFAKEKNLACYLEFEMTPEQNWIALKFNDIRKQSAEKYSPVIQTFVQNSKNYSFGMIFSYENISHVLDESNLMRVQCALSLGNNRYLLAPYWKFEEGNKEKPDFHQPQRFWPLKLLSPI